MQQGRILQEIFVSVNLEANARADIAKVVPDLETLAYKQGCSLYHRHHTYSYETGVLVSTCIKDRFSGFG